MNPHAPAIVAACLIGGVSHAQPPSSPGPTPAREDRQLQPTESLPRPLAVGDPAPPLTVETWVQGPPIEKFAPGRIFVVAFWATWCSASREAVDTLAAMHSRDGARGVTVVGVTTRDARNTPELVAQYLAEFGEKLPYAVAWDRDRRTVNTYLKAARINTIPTVFVVDQRGTLAYIGDPAGAPKVVDALVAGTFDPKAAAAEYEITLDLARQAERRANEAFTIVQQLSAATDREDWVGAALIAQQIEDSAETEAGRVIADEFVRLLITEGDPARAYLYGKNIAAKFEHNNAVALNEMAWAIVDPDHKLPDADADLDFALRCAERAAELAADQNRWMIVDTLARVHFRRGDVDRAIELQRQAVTSTRRPERRRELEATLREYESARDGRPSPPPTPSPASRPRSIRVD